MIYLILIGFLMMVVQAYLTYLQYQNYQKALKSLRGKNRYLGVGLRKGGLQFGKGMVIILAVDRRTRRVIGCRKLKGIAIWRRFQEVTEYTGYSIDELRELAILEDFKLNKRARLKRPYQKELKDPWRKKGALLQAIEALELRISDEKNRVLNEQRLKEIEQSLKRSCMNQNEQFVNETEIE